FYGQTFDFVRPALNLVECIAGEVDVLCQRQHLLQANRLVPAVYSSLLEERTDQGVSPGFVSFFKRRLRSGAGSEQGLRMRRLSRSRKLLLIFRHFVSFKL